MEQPSGQQTEHAQRHHIVQNGFGEAEHGEAAQYGDPCSGGG
jgi:hypothetical protein